MTDGRKEDRLLVTGTWKDTRAGGRVVYWNNFKKKKKKGGGGAKQGENGSRS